MFFVKLILQQKRIFRDKKNFQNIKNHSKRSCKSTLKKICRSKDGHMIFSVKWQILKKFLKDLRFRWKNHVPVFGSTDIFFEKLEIFSNIKVDAKFDCGSNARTPRPRKSLPEPPDQKRPKKYFFLTISGNPVTSFLPQPLSNALLKYQNYAKSCY